MSKGVGRWLAHFWDVPCRCNQRLRMPRHSSRQVAGSAPHTLQCYEAVTLLVALGPELEGMVLIVWCLGTGGRQGNLTNKKTPNLLGPPWTLGIGLR